MKRILNLLISLVAVASVAACADANSAYVRKAVKIMDRYGLFASGQQWEDAKAEALAVRPASIEEAQEAVRTALKVAGGKHSFLQSAESVTEDATSEWEMPSVEVSDGIAQIRLPHFSGNDSEGVKYAQTVLDAVPDDVRGVIIDLRGNNGGNMYPMIAAVHRFLPDDSNTLRMRTRKRTMWIPLSYVVKVCGVEQRPGLECPVALLTDGATGSSGEAVLLCFRGIERCRTFGAPTAGYASANQPFAMPDGSSLVLTTGCDVARTGEEFCDDPIAPDVLTDTPLEAALEWLGE